MLIIFPYSKNFEEGDIIALTREGNFFGYAEVIATMEDTFLLKIDKKASKTFFEMYGEQISFTVEF